MTRLIDADACIDYIRNNNQHAWEALAYAPTIDAVEVVRCKDCKYGVEERIDDYRCWMLDEDWDIRFSPMHFCSYGRRRKDGEA